MKLSRRQSLHLAAGAAAVPAASRIARAQTYPTRPITMIAPGAAGGIVDTFARIIAERMKDSLGQPIIIEAVGGAEGSIATARAARAKPDGYSIILGTIGTHVLNGALYSLRYDLLGDFAPILPLATAPLVLFARKTVPAKDLNELIAWLKANPDKVSAGIPATGSHLFTVFFQKETGTRFALVPYRGSPAAFQDLMAGRIDLVFYTLDQLPLVRAGSIRAYALTSETRSTLAPDMPTFAELGLPALSYSVWGGLFAPGGTPKDIIGKLNAVAVEALADPAVQSRLFDLGVEIFPRERQTPEALGAMQKADIEKWWPIIRAAGIKAE
jgi:tripartite-type tricarboxylate transporter receptor subunit TctC